MLKLASSACVTGCLPHPTASNCIHDPLFICVKYCGRTQEIRDEAKRRAHDPSVQADFSHAKGQHKLALMFLVDAVFLNAQMDKNEASLSADVRQAACKSISSFLPDLVRNLTTPSNFEQVLVHSPVHFGHMILN